MEIFGKMEKIYSRRRLMEKGGKSEKYQGSSRQI